MPEGQSQVVGVIGRRLTELPGQFQGPAVKAALLPDFNSKGHDHFQGFLSLRQIHFLSMKLPYLRVWRIKSAELTWKTFPPKVFLWKFRARSEDIIKRVETTSGHFTPNPKMAI